MARALVTGTTGFVGGHLVEALRNRGDEVVCLTRESSRTDLLDRQDVRQWWVWPSPPTPGIKS
jgi:nucleoside-diphosphate-sugar epimerase